METSSVGVTENRSSILAKTIPFTALILFFDKSIWAPDDLSKKQTIVKMY